MKAIGITGSPRKNGNTEIVTAHALKAIEEEGIETELISLAGLNIPRVVINEPDCVKKTFPGYFKQFFQCIG